MADDSKHRIIVPRFKKENGFQTTKERSALMSKIKSKDTKPEIAFRKAIWAMGIRYRKDVVRLPGRPDVVIEKYGIVIFIDGEFWHGFKWNEKKPKIKSNREFWIAKIERNMQRDNENNDKLRMKGYKVFRFWEHEIKNDLNSCIKQVIEAMPIMKS